MNQLYKWLLGIVGIIFIILFIIPETRYVPFAIIIFAPVGAVIGPYMFLTYPFSLLIKALYTFALICAASLVALGIIRRESKWRSLFIISGILLWGLLGLIGLGTGT